MMQPDLQRLAHIRDYCREIEMTVERYGKDFAIFDMDKDYQRSVSFSLLQIGELSAGVTDEFKSQTAGQVPWGPMKGMRNMMAHHYASMNREIIWETVLTDIPALERFCDQMLLAAAEGGE